MWKLFWFLHGVDYNEDDGAENDSNDADEYTDNGNNKVIMVIIMMVVIMAVIIIVRYYGTSYKS